MAVYFEINSAHRSRIEYPRPETFVAQTKTADKNDYVYKANEIGKWIILEDAGSVLLQVPKEFLSIPLEGCYLLSSSFQRQIVKYDMDQGVVTLDAAITGPTVASLRFSSPEFVTILSYDGTKTIRLQSFDHTFQVGNALFNPETKQIVKILNEIVDGESIILTLEYPLTNNVEGQLEYWECNANYSKDEGALKLYSSIAQSKNTTRQFSLEYLIVPKIAPEKVPYIGVSLKPGNGTGNLIFKCVVDKHHGKFTILRGIGIKHLFYFNGPLSYTFQLLDENDKPLFYVREVEYPSPINPYAQVRAVFKIE